KPVSRPNRPSQHLKWEARGSSRQPQAQRRAPALKSSRKSALPYLRGATHRACDGGLRRARPLLPGIRAVVDFVADVRAAPRPDGNGTTSVAADLVLVHRDLVNPDFPRRDGSLVLSPAEGHPGEHRRKRVAAHRTFPMQRRVLHAVEPEARLVVWQ